MSKMDYVRTKHKQVFLFIPFDQKYLNDLAGFTKLRKFDLFLGKLYSASKNAKMGSKNYEIGSKFDKMGSKNIER